MSAAESQRTAADPTLNVFVTANAGSGKTTTLVSRVARLLLAGVKPDAILCLTYTKAAAAEMQRRLFETLGGWAVLPDDAGGAQPSLREAMQELLGGGDFTQERLSAARRLFAQALETPGGLKIQTIHAFCERLLRRFPLEAGVSPRFSVADDAAAAEIAGAARDALAARAMAGEPVVADAYAAFAVALHHQAFEDMFRSFEAKRGAIAAYVERCGGLAGLPAAAAAACGLPGLRDAAEIETAAVLPPELDLEGWRRAAAGMALGSAKTDQPRGLRMAAVAEAAAAGEALVDEVRDLFFTEGKPRASVATKAVDTEVCAWLQGEQARLDAAFAAARANRVADDTVKALVLASVYADEYERAKARRGVLDFADLIQRTEALLTRRADAAWVLYKLDGGVDHILIDEAQDTAPEQWSILRALTAEFFAGEGAAARGPLPRSIFVVGDEKQSIFSFQGAAPERLDAEKGHYNALIVGAGGVFREVPLLESWRSTPQVLRFVDAVFAPEALHAALQPRPEGSVSTVQQIKHYALRNADGGCIDLWPLEREPEGEERDAWDEPLDQTTARNARRVLADRIAGEINRLVAAGEAVHDRRARAWRAAGYGDVLILVRRRGAMFEEILRALKRAGVPAAGADRLVLSEHAAFEDLLALARFALFPHDDLTLAGLLRSPFCDGDEQSLFDLAYGRGSTSLWRTLKDRAAERPEWTAAAELLAWVRREGGRRPPFDLFARLLERTDAAGRTQRARLLTRLGPEAEDVLGEFLAQALAAEARGIRSLEGFAHALAGLETSVKREMDEPKGLVRVMTAHGAKGLEAPIVFLPETILHEPRGGPLLETADGGFLWCASGKADCDGSGQARALRGQREEQEALRLLYVALTRARDRLVVCGRINARAKPENVKGWWRALDDAFAGPLAAEVRDVHEDDRTLRRFGPDPQRAQASPPATAAAAATPEWARRAAAPERSRAYTSPTRLARGGGAAPSPLAQQSGLGRFRRGDLIHKLLELLPDVPNAEREGAAAAYLAKQAGLDPAQRAEMAEAALGVLRDPTFAPVFGPSSRAEAALAGAVSGLPPVSGRVDRLVVEPDRVLVVDFKTNRDAPTTVEAADPAYLDQMATYTALLRAVFPGRSVEAALLWTDGPRLMPVPEALINARLSALGAD